ncbi:MAG: M23 family metallopeptidase [Myxococcota bacterium]
MSRHAVSLPEILGLRPLGPALRQSWGAIVGDGYAPPSRWGPSALRMLIPSMALPLWRGRVRPDGKTEVFNLPNRVPGPPGEGYSVRRTYARDFRGQKLTYDSHDGTDFALVQGTELVATAPGTVIDVRSDMQRGGAKVVLDHGAGLMTVSGHVARALVEPGAVVARGDVIALSGMSGVDGVLFSPWLPPHIHLAVMLNGAPVDPWAAPGEISLWRRHNDPVPYDLDPGAEEPTLEPTRWSEDAVAETIASCRDPALKRRLLSIPDLALRGPMTALERRTHRFRFGLERQLTEETYPRRAVFDLPVAASDHVGAVFADD